ncbi:MAG TPA: hypothetical protein VII01_16285 [Solirubrobacteraceae bacterium]
MAEPPDTETDREPHNGARGSAQKVLGGGERIDRPFLAEFK